MIKIDDVLYEYIDGSATAQLSIGTHATLYFSFDIGKHPEYKEFFIKKYESGYKFNISSSKYFAHNNIIKYIDLDINSKVLNLTVRCDVLESLSPDQRREGILEDLLNSTFGE